jgi:DNA-binding response OmpR family regulator
MTSKQHASILLVDDDLHFCAQLTAALGGEGIHTVVANDGASAQELCVKQTFSCIVLNLDMPSVNGATFLQLLRAFSFTPVLLCSANADNGEKLRYLQLGADDYLIKPVNMEELRVRIQNCVRRQTPEEPIATDDDTLYIDPRTRTVVVNGRSVKLTPSEFHILTLLMTKPNQLVSRRELVESLYPHVEYTGGFRVLDVHISNIRSKLTSSSMPANYIITSVYGVGYVYNGVKPRA